MVCCRIAGPITGENTLLTPFDLNPIEITEDGGSYAYDFSAIPAVIQLSINSEEVVLISPVVISLTFPSNVNQIFVYDVPHPAGFTIDSVGSTLTITFPIGTTISSEIGIGLVVF